ncbi:large ribosomal subunit protein mL37-like [Phocoena phocoena]|uniref:large ribosomal subunit protein mL37-like n=1 Tax=Phocoena phocoena TaxID=9742 RepID=UPI003306B4D4
MLLDVENEDHRGWVPSTPCAREDGGVLVEVLKRSDRYSVGIGASKAGTCSSQASRSWELRGPETWGVRVGHALHVEARASSPGQDVRDSWTGAHHLRGEDALYAWSGAVSLPALGPRLDAHEVPPLAPASRAPAVQGRGLLHLPPALLPPPRGCKAGPLAYQDQVNRGLPEKVLSLADNPRNHTENQDERVLYGISHACLWHSNEDIPKRETYCPVIVDSLIQLCKSQILKHPSLARQICAQNNTLSTTWNRESTLIQVHGSSGAQLNAKDPLPPPRLPRGSRSY